MTAAADRSPDVPESVGVLGGGRMGAGIAHAFLVRGAQVVVVERDPASAAAARDRIEASVRGSAARGAIGDAAEVTGRLRVSTDRDDFRRSDLVIEAVPEVAPLKIEALADIEKRLSETASLATNTSSLSIGELSAVLERPHRFLGLHFFNPVPASTLVEIVTSDSTSAETLERAQRWVRGLGKTAITVRDSPGFASSRLGVMLALEAMRMVDEGVASPEDIDAAMVLGYKHPVGPLRTTDIVGLDVRLGIAEYLTQTLGDRFSPPEILRRKVAAGDLGRKSGRGFFDWPSSGT